MGRPPPVGVSPSPRKLRQPASVVAHPSTRHISPSKPDKSSLFPKSRKNQPPSSATFNPSLPPTTPAYPNARLPRMNESLLSLNGSPLANPFEMGMSWFQRMGNGDADEKSSGRANGKRANPIFVRRDPSFAVGSTNGFHPHTSSQSSQGTGRSRGNSRSRSKPPPSPPPQPDDIEDPPLRAPGAAFVAIPTKDGNLLEFDPLMTSPTSLNALEGISDSAKKQAREDMSRLIQAAVDKWKTS